MVNEKEATAVAAVSLVGTTTFSCENDDATKPGGTISATVKAEHTALKEYRDAIHNLIDAIKTVAQSSDTKGTQ